MYSSYSAAVVGTKNMQESPASVLKFSKTLYGTKFATNKLLKSLLDNEKTIGVGYFTGSSCRELVISYLAGYNSRVAVAAECGYTTYTTIQCSGDEDQRSALAYLSLPEAKQKLFSKLLSSIVGSYGVDIVADDGNKTGTPTVSLTFSNISSTHHIRISAMLLAVRILAKLLSVDKEASFINHKEGTYDCLRDFSKAMVNNIKTLSEGGSSSDGMDWTSLLLASAFIAFPHQAVERGYKYGVTGPVGFVRSSNFPKDGWITLAKNIGTEKFLKEFAPIKQQTMMLNTYVEELYALQKKNAARKAKATKTTGEQ